MTEDVRATSPCPSAETLAAYIDGRLEGHDRDGLESHLNHCAECYEVLVDAVRLAEGWASLPEPGKALLLRPVWRRAPIGALGGLLAASLAIVTWMAWPQTGPISETNQAVAVLVEGSRTQRFTRGRVGDDAPWAPAPSAARGTEGATLSLEAQQAVVRLQQIAQVSRTSATLRGAAIAFLAVGRLDDAVEAFEEALALDPGDARAHADFSAALLDRAASVDDDFDVARALDHAERAARLQPTDRTALFNRALALQTLGNRPGATAAWREYLAIEPDERWAAEAREHLAFLGEGTARLPAELLVASLADEDLLALARTHPAWLDRVLTRRLLPAWSRSLNPGDAAAAGRVGEMLDSVGAASGATAVAAAAQRSATWPLDRKRCLAETANLLSTWELAVERDDRPTGLTAAERLVAAVTCAGADSIVAALPSAWVLMVSGRRDAAADLAKRSADTAQTRRYRRLEASLCELLSALAIHDTRLSDATEVRLRGRAAAEAAGDREAMARFEDLLGEAANEQGDRSAAWAHFRQALGALDDSVPPLQRYGTLATVTIAASHAALPGAATVFAGELVEAAAATEAIPYRLMAVMQYGRALTAVGDHDAGARNLLEAARLVSLLPPGASQRAWEAEVGWIAGVVHAMSDPPAALRGLTTAIAYFDSSGRQFRLAELLLHRGRVLRRLGDAAAAEADFSRGAALLEDQRPAIREEQLRISRTAGVWELFTELIDLRGHDAEASLAVLERAKARELMDVLSPAKEQHAPSVAELQACLPEGAQALVYAVLPSRLLIWIVDRRRVLLHAEPIARGELDRLVRAHVRELRNDGREEAGRELSRRLVPTQLELDADKTLIVVTDGPLARLPFAALAPDGRRLAEDAVLLFTPSLSFFCTEAGPATARRSALLVGIDEAIPGAKLPALLEVRREIAALAKLHPDHVALVGSEATAAAVIGDWARHGIVHFAGHAAVNDLRPSQSVLFTSPHASPASIDPEMIAASPPARGAWVILAACRTAGGRVFDGEGTMSLARPFLAAGVGAVLGSLWNIGDADARRLVERVHKSLVDGERLDRALALAQRALLREQAPPSVWSPYVVTGRTLISAGGHP